MTDINIGQISEALNNKTDRDFNNMNPSGLSKETIIDWGMPDYSAAVSLSIGTYSFEFDVYGSVCVAHEPNKVVSIYINDRYIGGRGNSNAYYSPNSIDFWLPKHSVLRIEGTPSSDSFYCPLKGENND